MKSLHIHILDLYISFIPCSWFGKNETLEGIGNKATFQDSTMWMGNALGEESVIKDDVIHSNRALSEGIITIAGKGRRVDPAM